MSDNCVKQLNNEKTKDEVSHEIDLNNQMLSSAENGDILGVKKCLDSDKNLVNVRDADLYTPLHRAAYNDHIDIAELLIKSGANVRSRTADGWEPIHSATKWANIEVIRLLLNCGADINAVSNGGNTALHLAAQSTQSTLSNNSKKVLEFLLFHEDIDISLRNDSGDTAYDIAKRCSSLHTLWDYL